MDYNDGCEDILCKKIKTLVDFITALASSYRLEVGSADELNKIALAKRHDVDEAIERADKLGDIIDHLQSDLKRLVRLYSKQLDLYIDELPVEFIIREELQVKPPEAATVENKGMDANENKEENEQ